jgi:hypothetical protein
VRPIARLSQLHAGGSPDPLVLAAGVGTKIVEKYDGQLTEELLNEAFAARSLDIDGAWEALEVLLDHPNDEAGLASYKK